jgi:hypothetical protein
MAEAEALGFPRRAQHDALRRLRHSLDDAITAPSLDHEVWAAHLGKVLTKMGRIFGKHVSETEAPDGSLHEIIQIKPHLQTRVRKIKDEHTELSTRINQLSSAARICGATDATIEDLRIEAGRLADAIRLHQAKGVDLVYEAYLREEGMG